LRKKRTKGQKKSGECQAIFVRKLFSPPVSERKFVKEKQNKKEVIKGQRFLVFEAGLFLGLYRTG
jgi:hypothetical protein